MKVVTLEDYEEAAMKTAVYPNVGDNLIYPVLNMNSEAGEVAGKVAKMIRKGEELDEKLARQIALELGDVLWELTLSSHEVGYTLQEIAEMNIHKLSGRKKRGVLKGEGDDR